MKKIFITTILCCIAFFPIFVFAQGGLQKTGEASGLIAYGDDPIEIGGNVLGALLTLVGVVFLIFMVYGGFRWMLARGNEDDVKKAQRIIWGAIIGVLVILAAYAITTIITNVTNPTPSSPSSGKPDAGGGGSGNVPLFYCISDGCAGTATTKDANCYSDVSSCLEVAVEGSDICAGVAASPIDCGGKAFGDLCAVQKPGGGYAEGTCKQQWFDSQDCFCNADATL